jgi:ribonuclease VapC
VASTSVVPELLLDAWPVMEWLKGRDPASAALEAMIEDCLAGRVSLSMCRINHGEVIYSVRKNFPPDRIDAALKAFHEVSMSVYSVDDVLVDDAVSIKSVYSVSYADAFAAALAIRRGLPLITGDPELLPLAALGLQIRWVGR